MEKLIFNGVKGFCISRTSNKNLERSNYIFFENNEFVQFQKYNLEIHYELHYRKDKKFVRLDCHAFPYKSYKTIEDYNKDVDCVVDKYKKDLHSAFKNEFGLQYKVHKNYKYNNTFLIKCVLDNKYDLNRCIGETEAFIENTYDKSSEIINRVLHK